MFNQVQVYYKKIYKGMCRQMIHSVHTDGSQRISRRFSMATREGYRIPDSHGTFKLRSASAAVSTSYWSGGTSSEPG